MFPASPSHATHTCILLVSIEVYLTASGTYYYRISCTCLGTGRTWHYATPHATALSDTRQSCKDHRSAMAYEGEAANEDFVAQYGRFEGCETLIESIVIVLPHSAMSYEVKCR